MAKTADTLTVSLRRPSQSYDKSVLTGLQHYNDRKHFEEKIVEGAITAAGTKSKIFPIIYSTL